MTEQIRKHYLHSSLGMRRSKIRNSRTCPTGRRRRCSLSWAVCTCHFSFAVFIPRIFLLDLCHFWSYEKLSVKIRFNCHVLLPFFYYINKIDKNSVNKQSLKIKEIFLISVYSSVPYYYRGLVHNNGKFSVKYSNLRWDWMIQPVCVQLRYEEWSCF